MKIKALQIAIPFLLLQNWQACAAVLHVSVASTNPVPPYAAWSTAATNIQDAVDFANPGDQILVTNGLYASGRGVATGVVSNRVTITNAVTISSVNGPTVTFVDGGHTNRCFYLTAGVVLSGFTVTNGYADQGGGVYCTTPGTIVTNCMLVNNSAIGGGGAYGGSYTNCAILGNAASYAGGVAWSALYNCMLSNNIADQIGGGAWHCSLVGCTVACNSGYGGGAADCLLVNCSLIRNTGLVGGGAYESSLANCWLNGNSSQVQGGAAAYSYLSNCTVVGNSCVSGPGGTHLCTNYNSIIYFNGTVGGSANWLGGKMNYCCTVPLPDGSNNITADPALATFTYLSSSSPCRNAGGATFASGVDIDGEPWESPPSIGCDEYISGAVTGALTVTIQATYTNIVPAFSNNFTAQIMGRASASSWNFGDGTIVSNAPYVAHAWAQPGDYPVVLRAYNDSNAGGITATTMVHVVNQTVFYADANNVSPAFPYSSWASAATNIQDAVDAAYIGGGVVLVTNGVYAGGGRPSSDGTLTYLVLNKALTVKSINGPTATIIDGGRAIRCAYLTNGATLTGFSLINGCSTNGGSGNGGSVLCASSNALVSNCLLIGNSSRYGGGALSGTFSNCIFSGNICQGFGGAAHSSVLNNCVLVSNAVFSISSFGAGGGGATSCTLNNCLVSNNVAWVPFSSLTAVNGGGTYGCTLRNCTLVGNSATNVVGQGANQGGGSSSDTLVDCVLVGNRSDMGGGEYGGSVSGCTLSNNAASVAGGGAYGGNMTNCVISGNTASSGAGAYSSILVNCTVCLNSATNQGGGLVGGGALNSIIYYNTAPSGPNFISVNPSYCCLSPNIIGPNNFTNEPSFVNLASGDFHLQQGSPCINAGNNANVRSTLDLDNKPRIVGGAVDLGAYEVQNPSSISYLWLQRYGLPTDGSADFIDSDGDGMNNWQEWVAGTNPNNALSRLKMSAPSNGAPGVSVTWESVNNRTYYLRRSASLIAQPAFTSIKSNITGQVGRTTFTDSTATNPGPYFYQVGVQ